jgi:DNA polymerase-3 subunit alpha/error-prone DNA polymerase
MAVLRTEVYVHEAKMSGRPYTTSCVNKSEHETALYGIDVYLGFMQLEGLESKIAHFIVRSGRQTASSTEDFINRIPIGARRHTDSDFYWGLPLYGKTKNHYW